MRLAATILLCAACSAAPSEDGRRTIQPAHDLRDGTVIYELFVTDFTAEGTFDAVIPRLAELRDLGVTILWLMPIHPIGIERRQGALGSPYAVRDYYAVNPHYGSLASFRRLVEAVHAHGMHLIMDLVANHTAWDHPWTVQHPSWHQRDADGGLVVPRSPEGVPTNWTDVAALNYDSEALRKEMKRVMRHWVEAYDVDGFRCDVAEWIPYGFWAESIAELRAVKPVLMLAEGADPGLHAAGFDVTYGWPLYGALKSVWDGASAQGLRDLVRASRLPAGAQRLRLTTNHDETAWDQTPPQRFGGQAGARAASLLTHTLPGIPLLYNGQETGREAPVPFFEKTHYDWDANPEMRAFYETFFDFYRNSDALRGGSLTFHSSGDDVLVYSREAGGEEVVAVVNVRPGSRTVTLPAVLKSTGYVDVFRGEPTAARQTVPLEPFGFRLLASQ